MILGRQFLVDTLSCEQHAVCSLFGFASYQDILLQIRHHWLHSLGLFFYLVAIHTLPPSEHVTPPSMWACCQQSRWPWALACQETIRFISVSNRGYISICKRGTNSPCRARGRCPLDSGGLTFQFWALFPQSCKFRAQHEGTISGESAEERKGLWKWTRKPYFSLARGCRGLGLCGWQIPNFPGACFPLLLSKPL